MPAEGRENHLLKKGNSDAFFREKYLTKNSISSILLSPLKYHRNSSCRIDKGQGIVQFIHITTSFSQKSVSVMIINKSYHII